MELLPVELVSPSRLLFSGQAEEVLIPAFDGQRGILPCHSDFVGRISAGAIKIRRESKELWFAVRDGVFEVKAGELTIIVAVGETAEDVDIEEAQENLEKLEEVLAKINRATEDIADIEAHRLFELGRLEIAKYAKF